MAEFTKVANEYQRMCDNTGCVTCPINAERDGVACGYWILRNPEKTEGIVMKWSIDHPIKTNKMKFKEVFGFDYTDEFCATYRETEWLNAEYKEGQNENQNN